MTQLSMNLDLTLLSPSAQELAAVSRSHIYRQLLGAYYTPESAADFLADWAVRRNGERLLEPSFGDGIFLRAVAASALRENFTALHLSGIEIDTEAAARLDQTGFAGFDLRCADFLRVAPFPVQAVVGNPPYVRLRQLTTEQQSHAPAGDSGRHGPAYGSKRRPLDAVSSPCHALP